MANKYISKLNINSTSYLMKDEELRAKFDGIEFDAAAGTISFGGKVFALTEKSSDKPNEGVDDEPSTSTKTYYVGQMTASRSVFSEKTTDELISYATKVDVTSTGSIGEKTLPVTNTIFFLMIPTTSTLSKFVYVSDGNTSDILSNNAFNCTHDNVTIDNTEYKIYAYRQATTTVDNPLTYKYNINIQ